MSLNFLVGNQTISYRDSSAAAGFIGSTGLTLPAGVQATDTLIMIFGANFANRAEQDYLLPPSGWTKIFGYANTYAGGLDGVHAYWAPGNIGGSLEFSIDTGGGGTVYALQHLIAFTNVDTEWLSYSVSGSDIDNSGIIKSIATYAGGAVFGFISNGESPYANGSPPGGYTALADAIGANSQQAFYQAPTVAGITGNLTYSNATGYPVIQGIISLKPASTYGNMSDYFVTYDQFVGSKLYGTGDNRDGNLGIGVSSVLNYSSPVQIGSLTNWKQVSSKQYTAGAVKTDGTLWMFGFNSTGQLGNGTTTNYSSPIQVGSLNNWKQVAVGYSHTIALSTDGSFSGWGDNYYGNLGIGTNVNYSSPQITPTTVVRSVFAGSQVTYIIVNDVLGLPVGTALAAGRNTFGLLGDNTNTSSNNFDSVLIGPWSHLACGYHFTAGVKSDGTLWAWGDNHYGQLGNNSQISYSSPIQIGSLSNWKQVAAGQDHMSAVKTDGTVWSWGRGNNGQNGNNSVANYSSPIQIGSLTSWKQVSCGYGSTHAIKSDGTAWSWGLNGNGQAGQNNVTGSSSPIQIGTLTSWKQIESASFSTYGIITT
jgi:alpha-tubulin suppressor-like RCC1 family protein